MDNEEFLIAETWFDTPLSPFEASRLIRRLDDSLRQHGARSLGTHFAPDGTWRITRCIGSARAIRQAHYAAGLKLDRVSAVLIQAA